MINNPSLSEYEMLKDSSGMIVFLDDRIAFMKFYALLLDSSGLLAIIWWFCKDSKEGVGGDPSGILQDSSIWNGLGGGIWGSCEP